MDRFQANYCKHRNEFSFNEISVVSTLSRRGFQPEDCIRFHFHVHREYRFDDSKG